MSYYDIVMEVACEKESNAFSQDKIDSRLGISKGGRDLAYPQICRLPRRLLPGIPGGREL